MLEVLPSVSHQFGTVDHRFTPVIRQFPCVPCQYSSAEHAVSVRNISGWPVACQVVVRPRFRSIGHQRIRTGQEKTTNARVPNKTHASAWLPYIQRAPFCRWSPFQVLNLHKTFRRIERASPNKECICRMKNGHRRMRNVQETYVNAIR